MDLVMWTGPVAGLAAATLGVTGLMWRRTLAIRALAAFGAMYLASVAVWVPVSWAIGRGLLSPDPTFLSGIGLVALTAVAWAAIAWGLSRLGTWLSALAGPGERRRPGFLAFAVLLVGLDALLAASLGALAAGALDGMA